MTDQSNRHIAGDEELLARYALGTLEADTREAVERHIAGCDACAAAVRRERLIAAGARRLGRDQIKRRLGQTPIVEGSRPTVWPRVLSAAAVLGLIVGAGLYYDWLGSGTGDVSPVTEQKAQFETPAQESGKAAPPTASAPPGRDQDAGVSDARRESGRFAQAVPPVTGEKKSFRSDQSAARTMQGEVGATQPSAAGAAAGISREKEGMEAVAAPAVYWTEGTPLSGVGELGAAQAADRVSDESRMLKKELDGKSKIDVQRKAAANELQSSMGNYRVNQAPASALPRERQMVQQRNAGGGVQTLVKQDGNITTMTLFLDSLVDPIEAKSANVEAVSDDSLIVNLGKQRIGYRIPTGVNKEQQKPVK